MKKHLFLILLAVLLLPLHRADAQVKFGLKTGLSVSKISFSQDLFKSDNRTGWFVGPTMKYTFPLVGVGIDASALYEQNSAKIAQANAQGGETTVTQKMVVVPVNVRWSYGLGSMAGVFVFAGPQFGFNVGKDDFAWYSGKDYMSTFRLKKSNVSINVGAGVSLISHLQLAANYNIATGKTGEARTGNSENTLGSVSTGRTNSWQVSLSYFF